MERAYWTRLIWWATVCSLLLLLGPVAGQEKQGRATVYFSEVVPRNSETYKTEEGGTPDLIELYNYGNGPVDLKGFVVSDKDSVEKGWTIPESAVIPAGGWLVLYADGSGRVTNEGLFPDFKLSGDGEELFLFDPQGNKVASMAFPMLGPDQSFGVAGGQQANSADLTYRVLIEPTPGAANAAAASTGPIVMVKDYEGPATGDIEVEMSVWSPDTSISKATLTYVVNYGDEVEIPMQEAGDGTFKATIPAQQPGDMVRWYVTATDGSGAVTRAPQFLEPTSRKYFGTFMDDPSLATNLPVVHIYCENEKAPYTVDKETIPECSIMVNGKFYDNIIIRRRGVSSLNWPKPKFKVDAGEQGKIFEIFDSNGREVKEFNMNSEWAEPGENSFMRESLAWKAFQDMGVDSLDYYQTQVRFNGKYFGKFSLGEDWDEDPLEEAGYAVTPVPGPLMKSISGEFSNLRWDLDPFLAQYYYRPITEKNQVGFDQLSEFTKGIAGASGESRSEFIFDNVNLPKVINLMAAQTLVLNQDRCSKNFYVYLDPSTGQWSMLPWDLESAFSSDRGLGGTPARDYCILECEQWNSPLFCDKNHPQDLLVTTPWGLISTQVRPDRSGRRLLVDTPLGSVARALLQEPGNNGPGLTAGTPPNGAAMMGQTLPENSVISPGYDGDQTTIPVPQGAAGTYNFLIDAILSIPTTRAMYVRRLRTLMDEYLQTGKLAEIVTSEYEIIKEEAVRDIEHWGHPGNAERGYTQIVSEQIPIRTKQLYETYGPDGEIPLIPEAQPADATLELVTIEPGANGYIQFSNPNDIALDVSNWKVEGDGFKFKFLPGTVVPANGVIYIAATSIANFKNRTKPPTGGQGNFVVGPIEGTLQGSTATLSKA